MARRWRFAIAVLVMVGAGAWLGGCLETTTPSEGQVLGDEVYLLVGVNLAIFFGFMALYSVMASRQRRGGTTLLEPPLKGEEKSKAQAQPPPENARVCGTCGTPNPPNRKFCTGCGFRLK